MKNTVTVTVQTEDLNGHSALARVTKVVRLGEDIYEAINVAAAEASSLSQYQLRAGSTKSIHRHPEWMR